jgi:hypothetical protein
METSFLCPFPRSQRRAFGMFVQHLPCRAARDSQPNEQHCSDDHPQLVTYLSPVGHTFIISNISHTYRRQLKRRKQACFIYVSICLSELIYVYEC